MSRDESAADPEGRLTARLDGVSTEVVGDDFVLHDAITGEVHFLNQTAALVWDLCDGSLSFDALVEAVAQRFGRAPAEVRDDVGCVLAKLREHGLLLDPEPGSGSSPMP